LILESTGGGLIICNVYFSNQVDSMTFTPIAGVELIPTVLSNQNCKAGVQCIRLKFVEFVDGPEYQERSLEACGTDMQSRVAPGEIYE
jgi:hypothetical protein